MRITTGLELNKPKFDVMLKGLLHGYKPAKNVAFATGGYNLILVGTTQDGVTATVKNILKGECPENILCIGADYVFGDNWHVDLHGFIIYLPELRFVSDAGMSQILYSLEKIHKAMTEESDVQTYYGPGIMQHVYEHQYKRWFSNEAAFHVFDYNTKPEGDVLVFDAKLFHEYGNLFIKESNALHRQTYPVLFPWIKADAVLFDIDLSQFSDEAFAYMLMRCQSVNPNLRRYVHRDIAKRQFEYHKWLLDTNFHGFLDREFDDRDNDRDTLTWVNPKMPTAEQIADSCVGGGKSVVDVGPNSVTINTPGSLEVKGNQ